MDKAKIVILSTGGTITGIAQCKNALDYKVGKISIESILTPKMHTLADISVEQIANINSADLSSKILLKLARRVNQLLRDSIIDGIVITHGTDTMEESAFFLHLTTHPQIPIVFTGAMRPQNVRDSDGMRNLHNAILAAISGTKGVFVVMNGEILMARDVSKTHTLNLDAFSAPNSSRVGRISTGKARFLRPLESNKGAFFDISQVKKLPQVSIIHSFEGAIPLLEGALKAKCKGIVIAGSGAGSIHNNLKAILIKLLKKHKIIIVKSSYINAGAVLLSAKERAGGFISAKDLNPQKARILLQLALLDKRATREKIARIFERI